MGSRPRVLLIAEAANPEWVSVPLAGWSHACALRELADAHVVTQIRNREAIDRFGWKEGREYTAIDSEAIGRPLFRLGATVKRFTGLGWTTSTAFAAFPYYYFEHLVWKRFQAALEQGAYDIVHRLTPLTPTAPSLIAKRCRRAGIPFVWGPVNGGLPWPKGFNDVRHAEGEWLSYIRDAYRLLPRYRSTRADASAILIGSRATWDQMGPYANKCVYVPENAIDPERFPEPASPPSEGPLRVVFIGRLVPYKGADMLIEAALPLIANGQLELEILGDGQQMGELRTLVQSHGLDPGKLLPGWVPHQQLRQRLAQCHVFGFPSIREFGGAVVLEAMAMGVVPIVVDYGGPGELVTPRTGFSVPIGPRRNLIQEVRAILSRLTQDRSELRSMAARGRERVATYFTWEAKARQVLQVYEWVLGRATKPDFGMPIPDLESTLSATG